LGASRNPKLFMQSGDVFEAEIEHIGTLTNSVADEGRIGWHTPKKMRGELTTLKRNLSCRRPNANALPPSASSALPLLLGEINVHVVGNGPAMVLLAQPFDDRADVARTSRPFRKQP